MVVDVRAAWVSPSLHNSILVALSAASASFAFYVQCPRWIVVALARPYHGLSCTPVTITAVEKRVGDLKSEALPPSSHYEVFLGPLGPWNLGGQPTGIEN